MTPPQADGVLNRRSELARESGWMNLKLFAGKPTPTCFRRKQREFNP